MGSLAMRTKQLLVVRGMNDTEVPPYGKTTGDTTPRKSYRSMTPIAFHESYQLCRDDTRTI